MTGKSIVELIDAVDYEFAKKASYFLSCRPDFCPICEGLIVERVRARAPAIAESDIINALPAWRQWRHSLKPTKSHAFDRA
jgi:hypothetical protein